MPINETELIEELEGIDKQDLTTVYNQLTSLIGNLRGASDQDLTTLFDHLDAVEGNLEGLDSQTLTNVFNEIGNQAGNIQGVNSEDLTTLLNELGTQEGNLEGLNNNTLTDIVNELGTQEGNLEGTGAYTLTDLFNELSKLSTGQTNKAGLAYGQLALAAASTSEALNGGTSLTIPDNFGLRVTALAGNAGNVFIGDSGVTESNGYQLAPKAGIIPYIDDVSKIYVIGPNAGDGVSWAVEQ